MDNLIGMCLLFRYMSVGDSETFQVFADGSGRRIDITLYGHTERQLHIQQSDSKTQPHSHS